MSHNLAARLSRDRTRIFCGARGCDDILCWVSAWERVGDVIIIRTPLLNAGPGPVDVQTLDFPTRDWKLLIRRTEHEPWHEMEPGEAAHRIVFRRGWAPDTNGIWAMAKRARRNLDAGRAPRVRRGWVQFLGSKKLQEGEVLRPPAFPLHARCREGTVSLVDPDALGLVEGVQVWGPLRRR